MITAPQMTDAEHNLARLIKLCCLVIITSAVIYLAMDRLEAILIPLMIAVAFSYLLTPLIDAFSCRHIEGYPAAFRLPRGLAVLLSFGVAVAILLSLGLIILQALSTFRARSSLYRARMEEVLAGLFEAAKELNERMGVNGPHSFEGGPNRGGTALEEASDMVKAFMKDISITDLILHLLGTAAHVAEDLMYIILFLVFMLMHTPNETPDGNSRHTVSAKVERQIFVYIRGKASISGFVGGCHAAVLWFVGLELWLPFGVVTFFLNFIPNVGGLAAVMLPMPLVALDPAFGPSGVATALLVVRRIHTLSLTLSALLMLTPSSLVLSSLATQPLLVNIFAKDVLEPCLIGNATRLKPVAVLLAILVYGSVWGTTGMVMAIPLTAVMRIYLSSLEHPLARFVGAALSGEDHSNGVPPSPVTPGRVTEAPAMV